MANLLRANLHALVFDAYGTLFNVHSVITSCEEIFPGNGAALSQLWRSKQLEYTWLRSLMGRYADFNQVTGDALKFACASMGLPCTQQTHQTLNLAYRNLQPFDDAIIALTLIKKVHPHLKLAILSNGAPEMLNAVVRHNRLESIFDEILSVDAVGIFKPDPRVYQLAVDRLQVPSSQIGFISSNGWDAVGAKAFGFSVFWVNRLAMPVEELGVASDHTITTLQQLPALLGGSPSC